MKLRALVGVGDRVTGLALPFAVAGIAANIIWPSAMLESTFPSEYPSYRARVLLPWL